MAEIFDDKLTASKLSSELWLRAFKSLSDEDRRRVDFAQNGGQAIVKAILTSAEEKKKEAEDKAWTYTRKNGEVIVLRHVFGKIVDSITKFQDAADFLVSLDASGHAALPWAGVKFFLSIAVKDTKRWGAVLEGMEFVTREISYYGIFEVLYLRRKFDATQQLSEALVRAYSTILQYLSKARHYYEKNTLERALSAAFSFDSKLEGIVSAIKSDREEVAHLKELIDGQQDKEMGEGIVLLTENQKTYQQKLEWMLKDLAAPMEVLSAQLANMQSKQDELLLEYQKRAKADQLPRISNHLQPGKVPDYQELLKGLTAGTATWILHARPFKEWIDGEKPILLISGGPGTGKSHLSTFLIDHLRQKAMDEGCQDSVAYYYFNGRDNKTRSVLNALCTIVYELATEDEVYCMHAVEACDQSPAYAMTTTRTVWNDFLAKEFRATSNNQLFIVLDGIDEAERDEFRELVTLLSDSVQERLRIQILLVGRPEMENLVKNEIVESSVGIIEVSSKVTFNDIRSVSEARYNTYIKVQKFKSLKEKVITTIAEKAKGMFLWVDLTYKELQGILPQQLRLALGNLPDGGLTGLYDRIFSRIETDTSTVKQLAQLKELFCWTAHFKEPLSLFYLNQIIRFAAKDELFDAEWTIEKTCASLLVIVKTGDVLFDESRLDAAASGIDMSSTKEDPEDEDEVYDDDEEKENEAINEEEERNQNRHREIFVNLRHASLGDYLKRSNLEPTPILLTARDASAHIVLTSLRIICKGADSPQELWLYLMTTFLDQLRSVDEKNVSEEDTKRIVEHLLEIFLLKPLQTHIAKFHATPNGYPLLGDSGDGDCFFFGTNINLQHKNRLVVQKWFKKADRMTSVKLDDEASKWIKTVIEEPLKLLIPLTKTCIREWLACDGPAFEMYWRFRFAWQCIVSTDLIPPCTTENADFLQLSPSFLGGDPFSFLAGVLEEVKTMGSSFQIARTMSFGGTHRELSKAEYQNAIEMAQKQGSEETLKKIYLEQISAFVDTRLMESDEQARQYIENFLALDKSNAQVYASLGVVRFQERDYPGAIEAFQVSLGLEDDRATKEHSYSRSFVGIALLQTMFTIKDYDGMMSQIERYGASAIGFWFRENLDDTYFQRRVMYAARKTSKIDLLIKCYQQEINNGQLSEKDLQAIMNCDPAERARLKLRLRSTRLATSSMFRCYLGWLYQECLGQPKEAIELWKIAFFQRPEFLKLGKIYSSLFTDEIVPEMFARFSQLLYDKALQPDGGVDESMVTLLETLRQRQEDFRNLDTNCVELTNQRSLNLLLARLYWRCGRKEEAQKLLNEQFQRAVDILRDDIGWNDLYGYELLARVLFTNGQEEKAKLAASLTRFFYGGYNLEDNNAEDNEFGMGRPPPLTCAGWCTYSKGPRVGYETPLYACTTCANVVFCEGCHHSLRIQTGEDKIFVCNPNHDFLKSPAEGLECIKGDLITMNGKRQPFTAWLEEVQKEWKTGLYFQT